MCATSCARCLLVAICCLLMGQSGPCGPARPVDDDGDDLPQDGGGQITSTTIGGTLQVVDLDVPLGQTTMVTSDLVINASGNVNIGGNLLADPAAVAGGQGPGITIIAQGDVQISGMIQAGDGGLVEATTARRANGSDSSDTGRNGNHGGSIQVITDANLSVVSGAMITAGNGTPGTGGTRGGAGGNGGHVVLCAGGLLKMEGSIHVGDGGNGGDATTTSTNSAPTQFENRGGDSGFLYVNASTYDWPGLDTVDLSLDPMTYGLASGGTGGNAGFVFIIDDFVDCMGASIFTAVQAETRTGQADGAIVGTVYKQRRAANGGRGWWMGGAGGPIQLAVACSYDGRDGDSWSVQAGHGGDVTRRQSASPGCVASPIVLEGAFGGLGGLASGVVASGMLGDSAHPDGGKGGSVEVIGGNGGDGEFFGGHVGGAGGMAQASGGFGGIGFSRDCENPGPGGNGGNGGDGDTRGGDGGDGAVPGPGGEAVALGANPGDVASSGGDGGTGVPGGGTGGKGGNLTTTQGANGASSPNAIVGWLEKLAVAPDGNPGDSFELAWCQN